jgi:hypothetical protein
MLARKQLPDHPTGGFTEEVDLTDAELIQSVDYLVADGVHRIVVCLLIGYTGIAVSTSIAPDDFVVPRKGRDPVVPEGTMPSKSVLYQNGVG